MTAIASLLALSIIFIYRVLESMSDDQLVLLGRGWSLDRLSVILLHFGACRVRFQLAGRRGVTVLKPLNSAIICAPSKRMMLAISGK